MNFERHGRGKKFGGAAEVCPNSFLCPTSFAADDADIWESFIFASKVTGNSKLRRAQLEMCQIGSDGGKVEIVESKLRHTSVTGGTALKCFIDDSTISGNPYFRGSGRGITIVGARISGDVVLEGEAGIFGATLSGKMRIGFGGWTRAPRHFEFNNEIAEIGVTESTDGFAYIGCKRKLMTSWIRKRNLFLTAGGWSQEMGERLQRTFEEWLDVPIPTMAVRRAGVARNNFKRTGVNTNRFDGRLRCFIFTGSAADSVELSK
jgi:hypothetical protein